MRKKIMLMLVFASLFPLNACNPVNREGAEVPSDSNEHNEYVNDVEIPIDHELIAEAEALIEAIESGEVDPLSDPDMFIVSDVSSRLREQMIELGDFMIKNQELFQGYCLQEVGWLCSDGDRDWLENEYIRMLRDLEAQLFPDGMGMIYIKTTIV